MAAAAVWFWTSGPERGFEAELAESLKAVTFRVRCSACGETSEMSAAAYQNELGATGVTCPRCGQPKAWRIGNAADPDPAQFHEEMQQLTSESDASQAANAVQSEMNRLQNEINAAESAGDEASLTELRKALAVLQAKSTAIYARWEELGRGPE